MYNADTKIPPQIGRYLTVNLFMRTDKYAATTKYKNRYEGFYKVPVTTIM